MPLYEYECQACGSRFEAMQKLSDRPLRTCRSCKSRRVRRLISAPAVQFKGSGWYVTDYAGKKDREKGAAEKDAGGKKETESSSTESSSGKSSSDSQSVSKTEPTSSKASKKGAKE